MIKLTDSEIERLGLEKAPTTRSKAASRRSRRICCVDAITSNPGLPGYDVKCTFENDADGRDAPAE
jgi:hypothetical protein